MEKWLPRLHALVVGPGLGRDDLLLNNVRVSGVTVKHSASQIQYCMQMFLLFLRLSCLLLLVIGPHLGSGRSCVVGWRATSSGEGLPEQSRLDESLGSRVLFCMSSHRQ